MVAGETILRYIGWVEKLSTKNYVVLNIKEE
jgi:hypothetical protein